MLMLDFIAFLGCVAVAACVAWIWARRDAAKESETIIETTPLDIIETEPEILFGRADIGRAFGVVSDVAPHPTPVAAQQAPEPESSTPFEEVRAALLETPITRYWVAEYESKLRDKIAQHLGNIFGFDSVCCECTLPDGKRIDIDVLGKAGIEVKMANQLYGNNSDRLLGQVVVYRRHYGKNLFVVVGGLRADAPYFDTLRKRVEELGACFIFLCPKR